MDLLLDINVAVDICTRREPFFENADLAVSKCLSDGSRLWLYAGSVQTLEYVTRNELRRANLKEGLNITARQTEFQTRRVLKEFCADKHWLAASVGEGDVFDSPDPEDEQLIRAIDRFAPGTIRLLTRDEILCERYPGQAITPVQYLALPIPDQSINFIDLATQQDAVRTQLEKNIHRVLHHGQYIMGPEIAELEAKLAEFVGVGHCITASSGTDTLLIAMMALGVGAGDEVITTPFTFIATGEMIALLGARPVFVDVDPRTYNIDPAKIEAAITSRTRAIMPVSLYGQCADFDAINAIAAKYGLPVVEDGAQSFGATYKGRRSCGLSSIGSTSFFPSKPLGGYGDGGALFTNDDVMAKAMREIRVHGQDRRYHHPRIGINGRLDTMQAAILLAKLERFDWEVEQRVRIGTRYTELIKNICPGISTPIIEPHNTSVYAQYTIRVEGRDGVCKKLNAAGIPTAIHYPIPLHLQPAFAHFGCREKDFPVAEACAREVMSLPMYPDMDEAKQDKIIAAVKQAVLP